MADIVVYIGFLYDVITVWYHKWSQLIPWPWKHMVRHHNYHHWSKTNGVIANFMNRRPSWAPSWIWPLKWGPKICHRPFLNSSWKTDLEPTFISIWTLKLYGSKICYIANHTIATQNAIIFDCFTGLTNRRTEWVSDSVFKTTISLLEMAASTLSRMYLI